MVKMFTKALLNLVPQVQPTSVIMLIIIHHPLSQTQDLDALSVIFKRLLRFAPYVACKQIS